MIKPCNSICNDNNYVNCALIKIVISKNNPITRATFKVSVVHAYGMSQRVSNVYICLWHWAQVFVEI